MRIALLSLVALAWAQASAGAADTLHVGPGSAYATIGAAIAAAAPGDTIVVGPGVYAEPIVIDKPLVLIGDGEPTIDGGGSGHVVDARASIVFTGFVVRGSGIDVDNEDAGIMATGGPVVIVGNRFENVLYGIYVKDGAGSLVADNEIRGKPLPLPRRGDGIRLWYSSDSRIVDNRLEAVRDLVVYFSDRLLMRGNRVVGSRYGLHYMYSNDSRVEDNELVDNDVGAFLMYSAGLELNGNVFTGGRGATGMGLGLKDADAVSVIDNIFVDNAVGLHLDNSPRSAASPNTIESNGFVYNDVGVRLLPSVSGNAFVDNTLYHNSAPVVISGGARSGQAERNRWERNYWSEYAGFDADADGIGDTPFAHMRFSDQLVERHPELRFLERSPALAILDRAAHFFPLLRPAPVAVDSLPRLGPADFTRWGDDASEWASGTEASLPWLVVWSLVLTIVVAGVAGVVRRAR